jgi:hypothetical protein
MNRSNISVRHSVGIALLAVAAPAAFAQTSTASPTAVSPYSLTVFATAPSGLSAPDSIAVLHDHVFVGYGDGHAPDGSDGLSSQVVEYAADGSVVYTYTVKGHSDGLKVDPQTHKLWALQNEDASPSLVIIDPETHGQHKYSFSATANGGGYDDIVFRGCKVFFSASNPANNPNSGPAIVSGRLRSGVVEVEPVLAGNAKAIDLLTDSPVQLNLQDPDSMTLDPLGNIVLDSQADQQLIVLGNPGEANQKALRLPLSYTSSTGSTAVEVDDTAFVTSSEGYILFADKTLNTVYKLKRTAFSPGTAYTAADGGPFVGALDMASGVITPIVTGVKGPGGLVFVDQSERAGHHQEDASGSQCHDGDRE